MNASEEDAGIAATWVPLLREALAKEGSFRWPLRGTSMHPTLPKVCEIEIAPLPLRVTPGSLIVFANSNVLVAHRLVRRGRLGWIAQGDGRLSPDRPLAPGQVLGIVTFARKDDQTIWPSAAETLLRWFWVARHYALQAVRFVWDAMRRLRDRLRRGNGAPARHA